MFTGKTVKTTVENGRCVNVLLWKYKQEKVSTQHKSLDVLFTKLAKSPFSVSPTKIMENSSVIIFQLNKQKDTDPKTFNCI